MKREKVREGYSEDMMRWRRRRSGEVGELGEKKGTKKKGRRYDREATE